jgi:hypothetical protein
MPAQVIGFGTESILNRIEAAILDGYDEALITIDQRRATEDEARALLRQEAYVPLTTPSVSAENVHPRTLPSFIQTADEYRFYPLIALVPDTISKSPEDLRSDQQTVFQNAVTIHLMNRSDVDVPEEDAIAAMNAQFLVETRVIRMAEAMRLLIKSNTGMRKLFGNDGDPMMQLIS